MYLILRDTNSNHNNPLTHTPLSLSLLIKKQQQQIVQHEHYKKKIGKAPCYCKILSAYERS